MPAAGFFSSATSLRWAGHDGGASEASHRSHQACRSSYHAVQALSCCLLRDVGRSISKTPPFAPAQPGDPVHHLRVSATSVLSASTFGANEVTNLEAKKILDRLALGRHPKTGASLVATGLLTDADVLVALRTASVALARTPELARALAQTRRRTPPSELQREQFRHPRAGLPWSADEVRQLLQGFDSGVSITKLVDTHGRSMLGIATRLVTEGRDCRLSELVRADLRSKPARMAPIGPHELPI